MCPPANVYAEASLNRVGRGPITVVPYWGHQIQHFLYHCLPFSLLQKAILTHHKDIRRRALKKRAMKSDSIVCNKYSIDNCGCLVSRPVDASHCLTDSHLIHRSLLLVVDNELGSIRSYPQYNH